ncbi:MAG: hypothetical protein NC417_07285 [Candidatus Gastranaerophilales bacterium]|nr:hypothetical protein [Candidatus Gastranaerophilales bacterium]
MILEVSRFFKFRGILFPNVSNPQNLIKQGVPLKSFYTGFHAKARSFCGNAEEGMVCLARAQLSELFASDAS